MRIDILVSVLPKGINDLESEIEEDNIRNDIEKLLQEKGYDKYVVAGSYVISDKTKSKVCLD